MSRSETNLKQVAIVTGGSGGIGAGIVRRLSEAGHPVSIGFATTSGCERAHEFTEQLRSEGHSVMAVEMDVTSAESVDGALAQTTTHLGPPLILVNNGGIRGGHTVAKTELDEWDRIIAVNLTGTYLASRAALPAMRQAHWGRIINISSPAGDRAYLAAGAYGASKAGVNLLTKVMAMELATEGITVNALMPGVVLSEMMTSAGPELLDHLLRAEAAPRPVEAEEIGAMTAYLCGNESPMVNGQVIAVHGGGVSLPRREGGR